jgi:hypothetical protein
MVLASFAMAGLFAFASAGEPAYVGATKCKMCHLKQFKTWETTKMAMSFALLKPGIQAAEKTAAGLDPEADYTTDAQCLGCHTTGYGKPGGFVSLAETPELLGVQCESCHGPGSEYLADDKMSLKNKSYARDEIISAGLIIPEESTCTGSCHNDKSPFASAEDVFDFQTRKDEGTHDHIALKYPH